MSVIRLDAIANELCNKISSDTSSTLIGANGPPLDVVGQITILVAMDPPALNRYLWLLTNLL